MVVEGLVQGVGFRWFVARHAETLGLKGYVGNLYNGNVEIEVVGERGLIEEFIKEVKVGPRSAHVSNLKLDWLEDGKRAGYYTHFEIR
ncbi:MAG: acylphosphatase [Bacteroidota bacterium]